MAKQETKTIFRKQALDHLSSPEQLDQLPQVVTRKSWLPLLTLAGGLALAVIWSISGTIPITVEGQGLLIHRQQVVPFQAPASGQITELNIRVGTDVEAGDVLGRLNQPELQQRLAQEKVRLRDTRARDEVLLSMHADRVKVESDWIEKDRQRLQEQIASIRSNAEEQLVKSENYFERQLAHLAEFEKLTRDVGQFAQQRYEHFARLLEKNLTSAEDVNVAKRDFFDNRVKVADIQLRVHQTNILKIEARAEYQRQMNLVTEMQSKVEELDVRRKKIEQLLKEAQSESELRIQEIEDAIARYENQLETRGTIVSDYTGRIIEVTAAVGQIVNVGQRLGAIESQDEEGELVAVAFFRPADGKKIDENMDARISPSTVQREQFGSIVGAVTEVSPYPVTTDAVTNLVGNAELARTLTAGGSWIQVISTLESDPRSATGFRWTSGVGPDVEITVATTVSVRTTIESRRPISFVIPLLRRWSGQ